MKKVELKQNERIDDLEYQGLKIIQNKDKFCFGIDAVILSDFAKEIKKDKLVIDLGTGNGILPILLSEKTEAKKIIGVEIQEDVAEMAQRSVKLNKLENKIEIINEDIKELTKIMERGSIDAVISNPPYKKANTGLINENEAKLIARHEIKCNLEDIIKVTSFLLKDKGSFYMVHRPERLIEIIETLKKYKLEPKKMQFVYPKEEKAATMVLIKANKNEGSFLKIEPPLIIYNQNNTYTKEILKIYNKKSSII